MSWEPMAAVFTNFNGPAGVSKPYFGARIRSPYSSTAPRRVPKRDRYGERTLSGRRRQRVRLFARSLEHRVRARQRPRRPVSDEPELIVSGFESLQAFDILEHRSEGR